MRSILTALTGLITGFAFADQPILSDFKGLQAGLYGVSPHQTYHSSNITSPLFNVNNWRDDLIAGDESSHILLTLDYGEAGPYIFRDDDLSLVYADPSFTEVLNARIQKVKGVKYLSTWHGAKHGGNGAGFCVFYDNRYQLRYNLTVNNPKAALTDMHECEVTSEETVLLTTYQSKPYNLSSLGYTGNDTLADSCFEEIDIETNALIFSWCASDHFSVDLTFQNYTKEKRDDDPALLSPEGGVDVYHINSLQKTGDGHYLVSLRDLKMIAYINGLTGQPIWILNGKLNEFVDVTPSSALDANPESEGALSFGWQHTARFQDDALTKITLFDNHNLTTGVHCTGSSCSRGRYLEIDTSNSRNLTVQLVQDFFSPHDLNSMVMGSMQALPGFSNDRGNVFIGWGSVAEFGEYTHDGKIVRDVQYGALDPRTSFGGFGGHPSYRVYKHSWHGYPPWPPNVAMDGSGKLWVSWNGATEVRTWALYSSNSRAELGDVKGVGYDSSPGNALANQYPLETLDRAGFETEIVLRVSHAFMKLAALDGKGEIIGTTETVRVDSQALICQLDCLVLESILIP